MIWTTAKTARALELRKRRYAAASIGKELGTTKNAVLGKFHRLGLSEKGKNSHWPVERRVKFVVLWMSLAPIRQIAHEMSMSPGAVHNRRAIRGLPGRKELLANLAP